MIADFATRLSFAFLCLGLPVFRVSRSFAAAVFLCSQFLDFMLLCMSPILSSVSLLWSPFRVRGSRAGSRYVGVSVLSTFDQSACLNAALFSSRECTAPLPPLSSRIPFWGHTLLSIFPHASALFIFTCYTSLFRFFLLRTITLFLSLPDLALLSVAFPPSCFPPSALSPCFLLRPGLTSCFFSPRTTSLPLPPPLNPGAPASCFLTFPRILALLVPHLSFSPLPHLPSLTFLSPPLGSRFCPSMLLLAPLARCTLVCLNVHCFFHSLHFFSLFFTPLPGSRFYLHALCPSSPPRDSWPPPF